MKGTFPSCEYLCGNREGEDSREEGPYGVFFFFFFFSGVPLFCSVPFTEGSLLAAGMKRKCIQTYLPTYLPTQADRQSEGGGHAS